MQVTREAGLFVLPRDLSQESFRNVVLLQPHVIQGSYNDEHNRKRSLTAQQLEKIRDTIIRYSDLAAKRRADNT